MCTRDSVLNHIRLVFKLLHTVEMAPSLETSFVETTPNSVKLGSLKSIKKEDGDKNDLVLRVFRCLIADLCEQFKGGHPG